MHFLVPTSYFFQWSSKQNRPSTTYCSCYETKFHIQACQVPIPRRFQKKKKEVLISAQADKDINTK